MRREESERNRNSKERDGQQEEIERREARS